MTGFVLMQKGNRMTLKDADKIKEAIENCDDFNGGTDDILRVIDSVSEVMIDTDGDTISRAKAIEALTEYGHGRAVYIGVDTAVGCIDRLPPAQPERIIHCKDCEWWTKQEHSPQGRCALSGMYPTGGWFC